MTSQSRNWVFTRQATQAEATTWNATAAAVIVDPFTWHTEDKVTFCKYQIERAPTTGQLHVQGMISFKASCRPTAVKKLIGNNPHVEICKDVKASLEYCGKAESRVWGPWEHGTAPAGQGKRTDLHKIWTDVKAGKRTLDMIEEDPSIAKFEKHLKFLRFAHQEAESDRQATGIKCMIFYGETDLGKTYAAMNCIDPTSVFKMDPPASKGATLWWDGYEGEHTVVLDEFEGDNYCSLSKLKTLLDCYKCRLDVKGSFTWAAWKTVILCSNSAPRTWYPFAPAQRSIIQPLIRRITEIRHFTARGKYIIEDWDGLQLSDELDVEMPPTRAVTPASLPAVCGDTGTPPLSASAPIPVLCGPSPLVGDDDDDEYGGLIPSPVTHVPSQIQDTGLLSYLDSIPDNKYKSF